MDAADEARELYFARQADRNTYVSIAGSTYEVTEVPRGEDL